MAITLNFLIPRLMPGDPASIMFAQFKGKLKPEALDALSLIHISEPTRPY